MNFENHFQMLPPNNQRRKSSANRQWLVLGCIATVFGFLWFSAFQLKPRQHHYTPIIKHQSTFLETADHRHDAVEDAITRAESAQHLYKENKSKHPITAILVVNEYNANVGPIVSELSKRDFIHETILWQDGGKAYPQYEKLKSNPNLRLQYHISDSPMKKLAKWQACSQLAKTSACFYQGIYYDTFSYLESLYSQFVKRWDTMHVAVDPITMFHDSQLSFASEADRFHAGFAFLEYGAIFLKEFGHIYHDMAKGKDADWMNFADTLVTFGINRPHSFLSVHVYKFPTSLHETNLIHYNSYQRRVKPKALEAEVYSVETLWRKGTADMGFYQSDIEAAAACVKSRCTFYTSDIATPRSTLVSSMIDNVIKLKSLLPDCDVQSPTPSACVPEAAKLFAFMSYHHAVDGDTRTLWMSQSNATQGSVFGIDLLEPRTSLHNISVVVAHPFQRELVLEISDGVGDWFAVEHIPTNEYDLGEYVVLPLYSYSYPLDKLLQDAWNKITAVALGKEEPQHQQNNKHNNHNQQQQQKPLPPLYIRYIRFRCLRDMGAPFVVSEISFDHTDTQPMDHVAQLVDIAEENTWSDIEEK